MYSRYHYHPPPLLFFFFFTATATTEIYTLSLHDALPIFMEISRMRGQAARPSSVSSRCIRRRSTASSRTRDRKSTRLNSSHVSISYAVFCLKKKKNTNTRPPRDCYREC